MLKPNLKRATAALNDMFSFDVVSSSWTNITASLSLSAPSPRKFHGFAALSNVLYLFGGFDVLEGE